MSTATELPISKVVSLSLKRPTAIDARTAAQTSDDRRIELVAAKTLECHPHFRGRGEWAQCTCVNKCLRLDGCLPSYYLKQLAQEALRDLKEIDQIENRIVVSNPNGIVDANDSTASNHEGASRIRNPR